VGPDAADRDLSGEAVIRLAHDPSPPVLSPVRLQTTPVPSDSGTDDAEQRQEHAHTTPGSGDLTLEPPVRIDPMESGMVRPVASGSRVSHDSHPRLLSEFSNVIVTSASLTAAASVMGTGSVSGTSQADEDDEVASFMTLKSPAPFRGPPSRASRRSVSRQSVHSVPGDPLVELMSRMVEHSQQENSRREQEAKEEMLRREQETLRREQEVKEEAKRREQAFELREKELRRQNEQREYDLRHQTQVERENRYLSEKLAAAEREKEKELIALREKQEIELEKQEMEKLALCEKQAAEKLLSEKLLALEKQRMELEKQKIASFVGQQVPGNSRVAAETGSSIGSRDQSEEISDKIIFQGKIVSDAEMQSENKISSEINSELLFDDVDVHSYTAGTLHTLTVDDIEHTLLDDVAVCSQSVCTRPQLTGSLGAQHACLPVCTSATTVATQPPLPANLYSQPVPALTAVHQPDTSVQQLTTSVHSSVIGTRQQSATDLHQLSATAGVQQQSAVVYTQPSVIQSACTQPLTTWSVYTQPTYPQPLTRWTATALSPGTQPPHPSVSISVDGATALPDTAQSVWMSPAGVSPAQPGLLPSLDVRPACTQLPLPQPLYMQMPGAQPAYTQSAASQTLPTYTVGTQPVSQQGTSPLYNRYVGGAGHVALDPPVRHLGQTQTLSVTRPPAMSTQSIGQ